MFDKLIDFFIKIVNSLTLFLIVLMVRILIKLKYYGPIKPLWWIFVNYVYLRHLKVHSFFIFLRQVFFMFVFIFVSMFITSSFFLIFLIILEDSVLNFSFFACNKALIFFFLFFLVYLLLYDDEEFYKFFVSNFDDWENQWEELNFQILDDFENDPDAFLLDLDEDFELEPELDDTEFSWLNANIIEEGDERFYEEDDLLIDDLMSNLYFYESWHNYSIRFQSSLKFSQKNLYNLSRFNLISEKSQFDVLSNISINFKKFEKIDDSSFFHEFFNLERSNSRLSDTILLSLYFLDSDYSIKTPFSFNFSQFSFELSNYNVGYDFDLNLNHNSIISNSNFYRVDYFKYFFQKNHSYYFTYNDFDIQMSEIDFLTFFNDISFRFKNRFLFEDVSASENLSNEDFIFDDLLPYFYKDTFSESNFKTSDVFVNFLFRVVLQENSEFNKNISLFYFKKRILSFFVNKFIFSFFNIKFIKEIVYRRHLFFLLSLMSYNEKRFSSLLYLFFSENLLIRALQDKNFNSKEPLSLYSYRWNIVQSNFFNIRWANDENIMFEIFIKRNWVSFEVNDNNNIYLDFFSKRKKLRDVKVASVDSLASLIYLRSFYLIEDFFFFFLFFFSFFFSKIKTPVNSFKSFLFLVLKYNYNSELFLFKQRKTFFPYLFNDFFFSRIGFMPEVYFDSFFFKFSKSLYSNVSFNNISIFNKASSYIILNEIFISLDFYGVKLLNDIYFNNPNNSRLQRKYLDYFFINQISYFYNQPIINNIERFIDFQKDFYLKKNFWDFYNKGSFAFLNEKINLMEEETFSLILNRIWDFEYVSTKDQFILELGEDPVEGYGGTILVEENGDISTDEFDLLWDWTILNWNLLTDLNSEIDEYFNDDIFDPSFEDGTNYYTYIFILALIFWTVCKLYRFSNYSTGSFEILVPLYRTARLNDVFRFYFTDYVGSGRNRSLGINFVGGSKIMFQHANTIADEFLRTGYFPLKSRLNSGELRDLHKWLSILNYKETYVKTHLHLTNSLLSFRRSNTFFKKNSILWMKYARLNRGLTDDIFGFRDKEFFLKNLDKHEKQLQHVIFNRFVSEMRKSFKKQKFNLKSSNRNNKRGKKFVFRYGTRHDPLFAFNSRINDISYFRDVISPMNGLFNSGTILGNILYNFKNTDLLQSDIKFKRKLFRSDLEDLLKMTTYSYREGLRLFLFGSLGTDLLNKYAHNRLRLEKFEKEFLYDRFLKKIKPLNRYDFFFKNRDKFIKRKRLSNPIIFENVFMRLFLKRLRKSHRFKTNPFMTTAEYFAIYMKRKNKVRKPIREPDIDYVSKMRGSIKSLGLHAFIMDLKYNKNFDEKINYSILNNNIAYSHYAGFYGSLLRNFIQYRNNVRRKFLLAIKRVPYIFKLLNDMSDKERNFVLGDLGILRYLFSLLNGFLGEEFLYLHDSKNLRTNNLFLNNKYFFRWYKSIFKNPFSNFIYIKNRHNAKDINFNLIFNNKNLVWDFEKDIEKFFFKNKLYDDLEFYLRFLTREYEWLDDFSVWYDYYEGAELMRTYFLMFLTPFYLKNRLKNSQNINLSKTHFYKLISNIRNTPKRNPLFALILQHFFNTDVKNLHNYRFNNLKGRPGKIVNRMFDAYILNSLLNTFSLYNEDSIKEKDTENFIYNFNYKSIKNEIEHMHVFENFPHRFRLPQVLFFNNKRDYIFDKPVFNKFLAKGYRQFRKSNYKFFFYEKVFNLGRPFMEHLEAEAGYNRLPHFGVNLMLPSPQLYFLEDIASFGSNSYRWYLGSIGDDLYPDTRRSLMNSTTIIWPYILRNALGLPSGDMPYLKFSNTGGMFPSVKSNAYGYSFYGYRYRPNLNSDFFDDMGFEDLNYPAEEESLGLVYLRTIARVVSSSVLPLYYKIFNYFLDRELINNFGNNLELRSPWLRKNSYKKHKFDREFKEYIYKDFGYSNNYFNIRESFDVPSIRFKVKAKSVINYLINSFFKRNNDGILLDDTNKNLNLQYTYNYGFFFSPVSSFYNNFAKGGTGILIFIFFYLFLYYFIWVPWMYFFFSINMYYDIEYGKDEPTMDDIKQDLEEIDEDEKAEFDLSPAYGEPQDVGARHSVLWGEEVADLIVSYYDALVFDYTALVEPPYFFYLNFKQLGFYGSSVFNIARNEFIDLENIFLFDTSSKFSYSILSIKEAAEDHYIKRSFRGVKPQYSMLFTEFVSLLTGFEIDDGDIREEYLDVAFIDNTFYSKFPTSLKYFEFVGNGFSFGDGFHIKEKYKLLQDTYGPMSTEQKYNNFYNLGRFNFNDPFKMNSLRTTVWMSLKYLLQGIESLGINYKLYQHNDLWFYTLPTEMKSDKLFYNELLSFFPKGHFGYIERNRLYNHDLQYKNGEMILPLYFRFFRTEDSYKFKDMEGISDFFINFVESVGTCFLQNTPDSVTFNDLSSYTSLQNSILVQPSNFDGIVSHEMLFGILYLFQQFIYEHSSLKYFDSIDNYILESFAFEINALYSSELTSFLSNNCDYSWSDWLFFFEESTDWTLTFDHNNLIEIEDDYILSREEFADWKAETDREIDEEELRTFPKMKSELMAEDELERKELQELGYPDSAIQLYLNDLRRKPDWIYDDVIESLILIVDEDELPKEGPFFPDYDTSFSYFLNDFRTNKFTLDYNYNNLVIYNLFSNNYLAKFDNEENLINDVFLQFLSMQFIDFALLFDHFQRYSIYGNAIQMKCSEIATIQNNYYFHLNYNENYFIKSNLNLCSIKGDYKINTKFYNLNVSFLKKIFYIFLFLLIYLIFI
jgi:hypothetical protein